MEHETFWDLLTDAPHWQFEIVTTVLFDVLIGLMIWPTIKKWFNHHEKDDNKVEELEKRLKLLEEKK